MAHTPIKGYRELTPGELAKINALKELAEVVGKAVSVDEVGHDADPRWLAIGRTHLQEGFMAIIRAIAKPTTF